jgi:hypothetical protein
MKLLPVLFVVLSAVISNQSLGDDYIVHLEELSYKNADLQFVKDLQSGVPGADEKKLKGQVVYRTEILVQSGSRFFTKTVVGKTTTTIRGELKPMPEPGWFHLEVNREVTEATGHFLQADDGTLVDISPKRTSRVNGPVELGKPISPLISFTESDSADDNSAAEKGTLSVLSVRLKPAKSPN